MRFRVALARSPSWRAGSSLRYNNCVETPIVLLISLHLSNNGQAVGVNIYEILAFFLLQGRLFCLASSLAQQADPAAAGHRAAGAADFRRLRE
jgi:hypothetical protein